MVYPSISGVKIKYSCFQSQCKQLNAIIDALEHHENFSRGNGVFFHGRNFGL